MKQIKISWIIHLFAALHAVVALSCRLAGFEDGLLLTILTMTMILLICRKRGMNIELTAASIIVANILGYLLGNAGARLFSIAFDSQYLIHPLATALTTEILGWSILLFSKISLTPWTLFRRKVGKVKRTNTYLCDKLSSPWTNLPQPNAGTACQAYAERIPNRRFW